MSTSASQAANEKTLRYVADCASDSELRSVMAQIQLPELFASSYEGLLLPRPLLASHRRINKFADDLGALFAMLVSLPQRLFGGDLLAYCAEVGISPQPAALMTRGATGDPPLFGRSDAFDDGDSFKLIEFNVGTELGGMDWGELARCLLDVPAFAEFAAEHQLKYTDTEQIFADLLRELAAPVATGERPTVVLLETTGGIATHANYRSVAEALRARGLDFRLGEVQDVELQEGRLELDGTPIDVVLRFYAAGEILARAERGDLIIKPSVGWGAVGAVLGEATTDDEWTTLLKQRANQGYVPQRVVRPVTEPVCDPDSGHVEDWIANWGVYVTPTGYNGTFSRALRPQDGRLITFGNPGTRGATAFNLPAKGTITAFCPGGTEGVVLYGRLTATGSFAAISFGPANNTRFGLGGTNLALSGISVFDTGGGQNAKADITGVLVIPRDPVIKAGGVYGGPGRVLAQVAEGGGNCGSRTLPEAVGSGRGKAGRHRRDHVPMVIMKGLAMTTTRIGASPAARRGGRPRGRLPAVVLVITGQNDVNGTEDTLRPGTSRARGRLSPVSRRRKFRRRGVALDRSFRMRELVLGPLVAIALMAPAPAGLACAAHPAVAARPASHALKVCDVAGDLCI